MVHCLQQYHPKGLCALARRQAEQVAAFKECMLLGIVHISQQTDIRAGT